MFENVDLSINFYFLQGIAGELVEEERRQEFVAQTERQKGSDRRRTLERECHERLGEFGIIAARGSSGRSRSGNEPNYPREYTNGERIGGASAR